MKRFILPLLISPLLIGVANCGFQPVYAPSGAAGLNASGVITVAPIDGRSGYFLRQELQKQLSIGLPGHVKPATLNIRLKENLSRLAFKPDGAASRSNINASVAYTLASEDGSLSGSVKATTTFAVPAQPYGDISAQTNASERNMRLLAKRIIDDIRLKESAKNAPKG